LFPAPSVPVFLVAATEAARAPVGGLARGLRSAGVAVVVDVDGKALKSQMKQADRSGARYAIIIGDDELSAGTATVKDLQDGSQRNVPVGALVEELGK
jgi:histidyl-tRNA synthetase